MSWEMTLQSIRDEGPCQPGWEKLRKSIGVRKPLSTVVTLEQILESNGVEDAQWALRCIKGHDREIRLYAVQCACHVRHLMTDPRSIYALECSERYAQGMEDDAALDAALAAAWAVLAAARAALAAARDATWYAASAAELEWQAGEMIRMIRGEGVYDLSWEDGL